MLTYLEKGQDLDELIKEGRVLVDYFAEWCMPCKMLGPILEQVAAEEKDLTIIKVDIDKFELEAAKAMVMSIPTLVYYKDGEKAYRQAGLLSKDQILDIVRG